MRTLDLVDISAAYLTSNVVEDWRVRGLRQPGKSEEQQCSFVPDPALEVDVPPEVTAVTPR